MVPVKQARPFVVIDDYVHVEARGRLLLLRGLAAAWRCRHRVYLKLGL